MKKYAVTILGQGQWTIDIEAKDEEEARAYAFVEFEKEPQRYQEIELIVDDIKEVK